MTPLSTRVDEAFVYLANKQVELKTVLLDLVRPVGSYYWSSDPTDPGTLFGGTWERIRGKFIYAEDDDIAVGATGGEKEHTLTLDEAPAHKHLPLLNETNKAKGSVTDYKFEVIRNMELSATGRYPFAYDSSSTYKTSGTNTSASDSIGAEDVTTSCATDFQGGGLPHNNMPPYEAAYCWKRIT